MLEAVQLSKSYPGKEALRNVSFRVAPGEIFCLLGANGAGKTTTINLFLQFIAPSGGQALIDGKEVSAHPVEAKRALAYIPENLMLYPNLTGMENLTYFSTLAQKKHDRPVLEAALKEAGLSAAEWDRRVSTYSKGMRQKVGIAIALAKEARVLLLDEPTSGLDPKASNEFSALLTRLRSKGVATLMATHDLFRAKETGTHIGIMKAGELVEQLSTAEVGHVDLEQLYLKHMN